MSTGTATTDGLLFGPTANGKSYLSLFYHRTTSGGRPDKHQWHPNVLPPAEFGVFELADTNEWDDVSGNYWAVHNNGKTVLGARGERLAHFPANGNASVPWHGFPVSPLERGDADAPPDEFVEEWIRQGVISKPFGRRIQKRKI